MTLRPQRPAPGVAARLYEGWLVVPFPGDDRDRVEIGVSPAANNGLVNTWARAFLGHTSDGERVAMIRPHQLGMTGVLTVWLRVNGDPRMAGTVTV